MTTTPADGLLSPGQIVHVRTSFPVRARHVHQPFINDVQDKLSRPKEQPMPSAGNEAVFIWLATSAQTFKIANAYLGGNERISFGYHPEAGNVADLDGVKIRDVSAPCVGDRLA